LFLTTKSISERYIEIQKVEFPTF